MASMSNINFSFDNPRFLDSCALVVSVEVHFSTNHVAAFGKLTALSNREWVNLPQSPMI